MNPPDPLDSLDPQVRTRKPVIAVVGGIGSGKTLVARQLGSLGCAVIDADRLAHRALDSPRLRGALVRWWGPDILGPDGRVDRSAVARIVFNDREQLRRLEGLVHPRVMRARDLLHRWYQGDSRVKAIVEDCPLLLEKGLDAGCNAVIFVQASREIRLRRLAASRGWTESDLAQREKTQLGLDKKLKRANYVVDNTAGEDQCLPQVRRILSQILDDQA